MILSGLEIRKKLGNEITIDPFKETQLNPNSYNLTLHNELLIYTDPILDMKKENKTKSLIIPSAGLVLNTGSLYLGRTNEYTITNNYIPMLEGRSSIGRLGISVHASAGFGDVGFAGYWTLEITCAKPVRIYPDIQICQIFYHHIEGDFVRYHSTKYQNNQGIVPSQLYKDF
ncbi:MAG: dCTP deaminase [Clostridia bacterium]|nr:dCTP deaminase [Clostridia bacterium]MDD4048255.1 dCTP deaminase [Clostridia bacterium]